MTNKQVAHFVMGLWHFVAGILVILCLLKYLFC
jgi:hypothetical protein